MLPTNFDNKDMRQEMISCMASWVRDYDVDGYRCDVAGWVPMDFWNEARTTLDQIKPVLMLAEAEGNELYSAFEMTYGWELHHIMNDIANKAVFLLVRNGQVKKGDTLMLEGVGGGFTWGAVLVRL